MIRGTISRRGPSLVPSTLSEGDHVGGDNAGRRDSFGRITEVLLDASSIKISSQGDKVDVIDHYATIEDHKVAFDRLDRINRFVANNERMTVSDAVATNFSENLNPSVWLFLAMVGASSALVGYWVDWFVELIIELRYYWASGYHPFVGLLIWIFSGMCFAWLAECICILICPEAKGSGIAEMKSILSGTILTRFLSFPALFTKFFGLIFAIGGGLSFGKEGPFVHLAAIIAHQLSKTVVFSSIVRTPGMKRQLLSAAVAAGVTATFGAPIGGALFSIEVTATYFTVSSLWKTFWCAAMTYLSFSVFHSLGLVNLFKYTDLPRFVISAELSLFVVLGVVCGLCSAYFVYTAARIMLFLKESSARFSQRRFGWIISGPFGPVLIVSIISSIATFQVFKFQDHEIINAMFTAGELPEEWKSIHWSVSVIGYMLYKALFTSVSLSLPIPAGVYTPIFATGSLLGRLFGEIVKLALPFSQPGAYAVAAAAGLTSGCTRTIATGVIVFEVIGQLENLLPVLITVLVSYTVAKLLSVSVYDLSLRVKALPYVPFLRVEAYKHTAQDIMDPRIVDFALSSESTYNDAALILRKFPHLLAIPLVESKSDSTLQGSIPRLEVESLLHQRELLYDEEKVNNADEVEDLPSPLTPTPLVNRKQSFAMLGVDSLEKFQDIEIDYSKLASKIDDAPLCVFPHTALPKLHYLFTMLGLGQTFVIEKGKVVGSLSIHELTLPNVSSNVEYTFNV